MKTQNDLLNQVLTELMELKSMMTKVTGFISEIHSIENQRRQKEIEDLSTPVTVTVNEDRDCMEFDPTSLRLERNDRILINDGTHFCIRGADVSEEKYNYKTWIIWEFNASRNAPLTVYGIVIDEDGSEDIGERLYLYRGKFKAFMFMYDDIDAEA